MSINQQYSRNDLPSVVYDVVVYGEHMADVGDVGKEVEGVSSLSMIGQAKDNGTSKSGDSSEVRGKPRGVEYISREGGKDEGY